MNNTLYKKIVSRQRDIWNDIRERTATCRVIEMFLVNYEKSNHYKSLESHEQNDYLEFKFLITDALNKSGYLCPPELVYITVEKYMSDYIQEEIDIYS